MRVLVLVLMTLCLLASGQVSVPTMTNTVTGSPEGWTNISGGFKGIYDIQTVDRSNVWLATLGGLAHFDGNLWRVVADDKRSVDDIAVVGDDQLWYTSSSELLYYDTGRTSLRMRFDDPIADIVMPTPNSGWLIIPNTNATDLWFYNGLEWTVNTQIPGLYRRVDVDSSDGLWLAGESGLAHVKDGAILTSWPMVGVEDVDMLSPETGWAVGGYCGGIPSLNQQMIWQYRAGNWQVSRQANEPGLLSVTAFSNDLVVAAGSSWTVVQGDGTTWKTVDSDPADCYQTTLVSESTGPPDVVLIGGTSRGTTLVSALEETHLRVLFGRETYHRVYMSDDGDGWLLSGDNIARIAYGKVGIVTGPDGYGTWSDIIVDAEDRVWLGGIGLFHREGASWIWDSQIAPFDVIRFRKDGEQRLWMLACRRSGGTPGPRQTALFVRTGEMWRLAHSRDDKECPTDMDVDESGGAWILYGDGVWRVTADGVESYDSSREFRGVLSSIAASEGHAWIGAQGAIFEWRDSAWRRLAIDDQAILDGDALADIGSMWAVGPRDVWAAASDGAVLHYDGVSWRLDGRSMAVNRAFRMYNWQMLGVQVLTNQSPRHQVWVVGTTNTIMKRDYEAHVPEQTPVPTATSARPGTSPVMLPLALQSSQIP